MEENWLALMSKQTQTKQVLETNQFTEKYGLALSKRLFRKHLPGYL